ncbi:MAG: hypothetical protein IPJ41_08920 [Phycisphaerales bacterium]|nr:hypothetical protein [Phycisphaerales bacterium]
MFHALASQVSARGRRRKAGQVGLGAASLAGGILLTLVVTHAGQREVNAPFVPMAPIAQGPASAPSTALPAPRQRPLVAYVVNDPTVIGRTAPDVSRPAVELLDDDELLMTLRASDLPAGLVRADGRTRLAFREPQARDSAP